MNAFNIDECVSKLAQQSGFMEGNEWLIAGAKAGLRAMAKTDLVERPQDKLDKEGNYIPGKYDSWFLNATIKTTMNKDKLYTFQDIAPEEQLLHCTETYNSLKFSKIDQSLGVGLCYIGQSVREIYDEVQNEKFANRSDFAEHNIYHKLGGLADVDFIQKPSQGRTFEVPPVLVQRKIMNKLFDNIVEDYETILVVNGDGGSASKRKRGYAIDTVYMKESDFKEASQNRISYGCRGYDYLYKKGFFDDLDIDKYKMVLINYFANPKVISEIVEKYKDTHVIVCGIVCDPVYDHPDVRKFDTDLQLMEYVDELKKKIDIKANKDRYEVIGVSPTKISVLVDHGIFTDDRWKKSKNFVSVNRVDVMKVLNLTGTFNGIEHGFLKILRNRTSFISSMSYRLTIEDPEKFMNNMRRFSIKNKVMYDEVNAKYLNYVNLPDSIVFAYRNGPGDMRFFDMNIEGEYWFRRYVLNKGLPIDSGQGLVLDPDRDFDDLPNFHYLAVKEVKHCLEVMENNGIGEDQVVDKPLKLPTFVIKGLYFNPLLNKWIRDDDFVVPYTIVNGSFSRDVGIDMDIMPNNDKVVYKQEYGEYEPIKIHRDLILRRNHNDVDKQNRVRMYHAEDVKIPKGYFCVERTPDAAVLGDMTKEDFNDFDDLTDVVDVDTGEYGELFDI